jgi:hypothetical protein
VTIVEGPVKVPPAGLAVTEKPTSTPPPLLPLLQALERQVSRTNRVETTMIP